nr:hypothetical protein [Tanacetum cinerariifolium]
MRYVDTKPNGEALRKCILQGPYKLSTVIISCQPTTDESPAVEERTVLETFSNITPENKAHYNAKKEAIHLILTGIVDDIYSIVDACKTAHESWIAIEMLQQGESLNKQDVKTSLFWELGRFTSRDEESIESYYFRYLLSNTKISKSYAPPSKQSSSTGSHVSPRHKGKKIAKPITPSSESDSEEDSDPEQAQKDNDMQKNLALAIKYFKKIYKPTKNNLITSSNTRNKSVDTSPRFKNDNQTRQFENQRTVTIAGARETVGSQVMQQMKIQYFKCKEFGHYAKEYRKPKRAKDYTYHKKKMLLCKQAKKGVPLQAKQAYWLEDTYEEVDEHELKAHYMLPNVEECDDERVVLANLIVNLKLDTDENKKIHKKLKKAHTSLSHELQECKSALEDYKSSLENSNITRDRCIIALQNKEIKLEKYKTYLDRTIEHDTLERKLKDTLELLAKKEHDIKEGLKIKAYEISFVKEKLDELVKHSLLTKSSYESLVKEKSKVRKDFKIKEENNLDKLIAMEKQLKIFNEIFYERNKSIQTIHMLAPKGSTYNERPTFNPMYLKKAQSENPCLYEIPYDTSDLANRFAPNREETFTFE